MIEERFFGKLFQINDLIEDFSKSNKNRKIEKKTGREGSFTFTLVPQGAIPVFNHSYSMLCTSWSFCKFDLVNKDLNLVEMTSDVSMF